MCPFSASRAIQNGSLPARCASKSVNSLTVANVNPRTKFAVVSVHASPMLSVDGVLAIQFVNGALCVLNRRVADLAIARLTS